MSKENERLRERIQRGEAEILRLEGLFIQVAQDLPVEWFRPSTSKGFQGENRLSIIKYWCE